MNVLLVACNPVCLPSPVYPLGMSVVAAALIRAGHTVRQLDWLASGMKPDALQGIIAETAPGLIGISFRNLDNVNACRPESFLAHLKACVSVIKGVADAPVVIGGSGVSVLPERVLEMAGADYAVVGEGEYAAVRLANALASGIRPARGVLPSAGELAPENIPSAAYDSTALAFCLREGGTVAVQTKRGCPFKCAYCTYPLLEGSRVRPRDCLEVLDDLHRLKAAGARHVFFTDAVFNDPDGHYLRLAEALRRNGPILPWTAFFRPGAVDQAAVEELKAAGLETAELGSDAATDVTLRGLAKPFRWAEIEASHRCFLDAGVRVSHSFLFGGPGETPATAEEGIRNIARLTGASSFIFCGVRLLPGTPLERRAREEGVVSEGQDMLSPVFYYSPEIDRGWLDARLRAAFANASHIVYPPDSADTGIACLRRHSLFEISV